MKLRKNKNKEVIKAAMRFQPWDYAFVLEAELEMFKKMYEFFSSDKVHVLDAPEIARDIKLVISLLNIILEKDNVLTLNTNSLFPEEHDWKLSKYVNTRNKARFGFTKQEDWILLRHDIRLQKAWYLYHKLRYYKMKQFWD